MKSVLIVEDEPSLAEMLVTVLEEDGYCAVSKASGEEALEFCGKLAPDLILSDLKMEGMDGLTLLQKIQSDDDLKDIPFALITASGETTVSDKARKLGAIAYIPKPVELDQLLRTVRGLVPPR